MRSLHALPILVLTAFTITGECAADEPARSWITFLSRRSGGNLLYKMRADGSELTPIFGGDLKDVPGLSPGLTLYREPHWTRQSPDRQFFISWATDTGLPQEKYQSPAHFMIYLGRLDGGPVRVLAPDADELFAWSPDSKRIAYAVHSVKQPHMPPGSAGRSPSTQIVVVGVDGSKEEVVLDQPGWWHVEDWSPDGKKLLLLTQSALSLKYGTSDLVEYDLARFEAVKGRMPPGSDLPSSTQIDSLITLLTGGQPMRTFDDGRYSPDGRRLAVTFSRHLRTPASEFDPKGIELGVIELPDATMRAIARYPEGLRGPICWSQDGTEIAFSRYLKDDDEREKAEPGSRLGIWSIPREGGQARFLTTGWSPDWR